LPLAPGRLSATTDCPICSATLAATSRPTMSVGPPGGNGMIMRMDLEGYVCANAAPVTSVDNAIASVPRTARDRRNIGNSAQ
jgi:hypothetical protein